MEMGRLTPDGTAEPVSRNQILRRERGQGNVHLPCSADHEEDWQPYPVDSYSCYMCDYTYLDTLVKNSPAIRYVSTDYEVFEHRYRTAHSTWLALRFREEPSGTDKTGKQ